MPNPAAIPTAPDAPREAAPRDAAAPRVDPAPEGPAAAAPSAGAPAGGKPAKAPRPKSRNFGMLLRLGPYMRPYRAMLWGAIGMLLMTTMLNLALPIAAGRVVDGFQAERVELMDWYFASALGVAAALAVATALRYYLVTNLGERVVADIRRDVYDRVIGMSPAFYEKVMTGEVLSRLNTDTTLLLSVVSSSASIALRNLLLLAGGMGLMVWTSPRLAGFALLIVPLVVGPILYFGRSVRRLSAVAQDRIAESSAQASETLLAAQTVQAFTHEAQSRAQYGSLIERAFAAARKRTLARSQLTVVLIFLVFGGVVGVLWIGARDLRDGAMTAGELVQFLIYAVLVAGAVGALAEIWGEIQRAAGATERLVDILEAEDPIAAPVVPVPPAAPARGEVRFDAVHFRYPSRPETPALDGFDLNVRAGETVALVGPSGAGKSTVFQLLLRFYDPEAGRILLDGVPVDAMAPEALRRGFAVVSQDPAIFADTIAANIRFGRPDATEAKVEDAARAAAAHDFIVALPRGYDTYVGERGIMLSGGQKQRIAIARAILRDAPVLLLDEATSALDAESERLVQQAVGRLSRDRTTLVIAHRLSTVKRADRIVVLDAGRIAAEGTHAALVAENGLYARLARLQFTDG